MEKERKLLSLTFQDDFATPDGTAFSSGTDIQSSHNSLGTSISPLILILTLIVLPTSVWGEKIIGLTPAINEILYDLGTGNEIAGVPESTRFPPWRKKLPEIGPYYRPDVEKIISLRPDKVIGATYQERYLKQLSEFGIKTLTIKDQTIDDILDSILKIGRFLGIEKKAILLRTKIKNCLKQINVKNSRSVRVVIILDVVGNKFFVAGEKSFVSEVVKLAGGINVVRSRIPYPQFSIEDILKLNPDIVLNLSMKKIDNSLLEKFNIKKINDPELTIPGPGIVKSVIILRKILGNPLKGKVNCLK